MPQRCLDCNQVTFPNDNTGLAASTCEHCGSTNLTCDHPSSYYDKVKRCFVCSTCGYEHKRGLKQLQKLAKNNESLSQLAKLLMIK